MSERQLSPEHLQKLRENAEKGRLRAMELKREGRLMLGRRRRISRCISTLSVDDMKGMIPRAVYEGILLSLDIMLNDFLKSKSEKLKLAAAEEFLSALGNTSFLKNIAALAKDTEKDNPQKVEWETDENTVQATSGTADNT